MKYINRKNRFYKPCVSTLLNEIDTANRWLNTKEVCAYTGLSSSTLNRAINKGQIFVSRTTGRNLYKKTWIDNFLEGSKWKRHILRSGHFLTKKY